MHRHHEYSDANTAADQTISEEFLQINVLFADQKNILLQQ
jgi:hypothetical protein